MRDRLESKDLQKAAMKTFEYAATLPEGSQEREIEIARAWRLKEFADEQKIDEDFYRDDGD